MDIDPALWTMLGGTAAALIAGYTAVRVEGIKALGKRTATAVDAAAGAASTAADAAATAADNTQAVANGYAAGTTTALARIIEGQARDREILRQLVTGQQQMIDAHGQTIARVDHLSGRVDGIDERVRAVERRP